MHELQEGEPEEVLTEFCRGVFNRINMIIRIGMQIEKKSVPLPSLAFPHHPNHINPIKTSPSISVQIP
jgi:hypothetical protein